MKAINFYSNALTNLKRTKFLLCIIKKKAKKDLFCVPTWEDSGLSVLIVFRLPSGLPANFHDQLMVGAGQTLKAEQVKLVFIVASSGKIKTMFFPTPDLSGEE